MDTFNEIKEVVRQLIVKLLPYIVVSTIFTTFKMAYADKKLTWLEWALTFLTSLAAGVSIGYITTSPLWCAVGTLFGREAMQWALQRFNEKNIDGTIKRFWDKKR